MGTPNLRILLTALLALAVTAVHAQTNNRLDAVQLIQLGDAQLRFGNSELALQHYTNAIQKDIAFADAYMKRAMLLSRLGQNTQALADMDRALELNPYSEYIFDRRAKVKFLLNDIKGAEDDLARAVALKPYDDLLRESRVDALLAMGKIEEAVRNWIPAVDAPG
ncbi:MAG: tetratricopeptide repeat protein [Flavobacteriales bacterium]|nr:tetratricopeptide repeat protein [Flavobacteriales bacterium]